MSKPLPSQLRAKWDAVIKKEGKRLGLADCRPFLENKMLNDIFYDGTFNGRPCVIKCSSKTPDSILNEYKLAHKVFSSFPSVTPEPLAHWISDDGGMAFIATARISGRSLTEILANGISETEADNFSDDILSLSRALENTDIVHRDLFADNLLLDADGHLKAIDFQFAIDRTDYRECVWMRKNWKYRYVIFGVNHDLGLGVWNDAAALAHIVEKLPPTPKTQAALDELRANFRRCAFIARPDTITKLKLQFYAFSLNIQKLIRHKNAAKCSQLKTRINRMQKKKNDI